MEIKSKVANITPTVDTVKVRSCAANAFKGFLYIFNSFSGCAGFAIMGISCWVLRHELSMDLAIIMDSQIYRLGAVICVVAGCTIVIISVVGCCGIKHENKCFLLGYVITLILVICMVFVAGVFSVQIYTRAENELEFLMMNTLSRNYGPGGNENASDPITSAWNNMQGTLNCCGVKTNTTNGRTYKRSSNWYREQPIVRRSKVPSSCCTESDGEIINQKDCQSNFLGYEFVYQQGCYDPVIQQIGVYVCLVSASAIGATILQVFGLIFSCIVVRHM